MDASSINLDDSVFVTADGADNPAFNVEEYGYTPALPSRAAAPAAAPQTADAATSITRNDDDDADGEGEVDLDDTDDFVDDFDDDDDDDDDEDVLMDVVVYERIMGRDVAFPPPPPPLASLENQPIERVVLESSSSF